MKEITLLQWKSFQILTRSMQQIQFLRISRKEEDDRKALEKVQYDEEGLPSLVKRLKDEDMKKRMKDISDQLLTKGEGFVPTQNSYGFLKAYQYHPDGSIQREAKRLKEELYRIFKKDIPKKYDENTSIKVVKRFGRDALQDIKPESENDKNYDKVVLSLYWQMQIEDVDNTALRLQTEGKNLNIHPGKYKWLMYNVRGTFRMNLSRKAKHW